MKVLCNLWLYYVIYGCVLMLIMIVLRFMFDLLCVLYDWIMCYMGDVWSWFMIVLCVFWLIYWVSMIIVCVLLLICYYVGYDCITCTMVAVLGIMIVLCVLCLIYSVVVRLSVVFYG